jgi:hypothetical protein
MWQLVFIGGRNRSILEKATYLQQVSDKLHHIKLYQIKIIFNMKQPDSFNREIFIVFYRYAIIFHGVRDGMLEVTFKGKMRRYQQLHVLDNISAIMWQLVFIGGRNRSILEKATYLQQVSDKLHHIKLYPA